MSRHAPAAELPRWMDWGLMPLLNLAMALLAAAGVMAAIGQDPWLALQLMVKGAFGDPLAISYTLYYTTNFIFTGLAVCVALHAGHFNIGGEGQAMMGGLAVGAVMLTAQPYVPAPLMLPLAVLAGMAAGALWAGVPGYLQAKRGSHVVITTIMFNFIASALMVFLVGRFFRVPGQPAVESHPFAEGLEMPAIHPLLNQWGIEVPSNPLNASVVLALLACVGVWVLLWKTRLGYELRALGASPDATRYAGMNPAKLTVLAMALSGGLAAMVGVNEIAGVHHKLLLDFTAGAGFTGIAVSLMGRNHPVGIVLAALLFGALYQGGAELAFELPSFTRDMVVSIQGLVVLFSGALALMLRPTVAWLYGAWLSLKKPSTATQEA